MSSKPLDIATARARLAGKQGRQYWRSLEELAETAEFQELLRREFPRQAGELRDALSRREFLAAALRLMGASLALGGLSACGAPAEAPDQLVPYVEQPEAIAPGEPLFFATAMRMGGYAQGVLARSNEGRPTKLEGNPDHPASLGATDIFTQAALLTLYDPDRSQTVLNLGRPSTWDSFLAALAGLIDSQRARQGAGLRLLTGAVTSPTLAAQIGQLLQQFPSARWYQHEPAGRDNARAGARLAFGQDASAVYRFDQAEIILSLDADFLYGEPGSVRYARDFAQRRRVRAGQASMNRLYMVEPGLTVTGSSADHRLPLRASAVEALARALAAALGVGGATDAAPAGIPASWFSALAADLQAHRGTSLVLAGDGQPPAVHALAHAINDVLGNVGATVVYTAPIEASAPNGGTLRELAGDIAAGGVELLLIVESNPAYSAPADMDFAAQLARVRTIVHLGLYEDETAALSHWHIPAAHDLESWSDARAYDGTAAIVQPLIAPLYGGKTAHELLAALLGQSGQSGLEIVRGYWQGQSLADDRAWRRALHDGVIANSALPPQELRIADGGALLADSPSSILNPPSSIEIVFRPDPTIWDGRFANNGWLQELPKPLSSLTWDNAAFLSPATAERLALTNEDVVELRYKGRSLRAPVWVQPGHADESVTLHLGYGRTRAGQVGSDLGANAYALRTADAPWFDGGLELIKTGGRYRLATTQNHFSMEGRELIRSATLAEFQQNPGFAQLPESDGQHESLYPAHPYAGYAWGMTIDTSACIGCGACTIACQAENNIPVVGKDQVIAGREMHWIRVDSYFEGGLENPAVAHQPVPCMQCENAPCELVCPVAATVHSSEGLNAMVYNRCVGTRYCSNNCPYKVRRFNFFQYAREDVPVIALMQNPEVTVRDRGVMEKCTYCVQRINKAKIDAEREGRTVRDGEIQTACQQVCPTQAIVFGNINDANSQVAQLKAQPLNYHLLGELNTRPRTTYLAKLRNPNTGIEE
jgi:molybdopterin-containing oxidoreductase family iron-sulfur binding subunit